MPTRSMNSMNRIVRHLRRAALLGDRKVLSDGRLLESFLACRDETAFEILVKRHGPMVLGVCRRVIGNFHDAQDAFQAVFLVLAKKARSIMPRDLVGNWLYGVAYRTALQARARLFRRRAREMQVKDMPQPTVSPDLDLRELHEALDLELSKLPDKYRVPILLCDLEGRPRKDVAGHLKIPEGTLSSRLAKGRRLLARRLARHGLALSSGALATALTQQAASAAIQPALVSVTVKAAALAAAGQSAAGLISAQVVALSQGVLKTMLLNKLKVITVLFLGIVLGGVGAGFIGIPDGTSARAVQAAQAANPGQPGRSAADDQEPIDGALLMNPQIQEELRLSKNQVNKLEAVSREVDGKNGPMHKQIQQIQAQIKELQKQIVKLEESIAGERTQALRKVAPAILSARAIKRLREIQRQKRGLRQLVQDPKVQRLLKLDDEQLMKIEDILKKEQTTLAAAAFLGVRDGSDRRVRLWNLDTGKEYRDVAYDYVLATLPDPGADAKTNRSLMDVLTDAQRKTLLHWVGEPYHSPSWQEFWDKHVKKGK